MALRKIEIIFAQKNQLEENLRQKISGKKIITKKISTKKNQ